MSLEAANFSPQVRHFVHPLPQEPMTGSGGCAGVTKMGRRCRRRVKGFDLVCGACTSWVTLDPALPTPTRNVYRTLRKACPTISGIHFRGLSRSSTGTLLIYVSDGVSENEAAARLTAAQVFPAGAAVVQNLTFRRYVNTAYLLVQQDRLHQDFDRAVEQVALEAPYLRNDTDYWVQARGKRYVPGSFAYWQFDGLLQPHAPNAEKARAAVAFVLATHDFDEAAMRWYSELRSQDNDVEVAAEFIKMTLTQ